MVCIEGTLTFGQWLRTWRTAKGFSIKGAAQLAGWKPQFWSNLEQEARTRRGGLPPKPDEKTVEVIARVLNLPIEIVMLAAGHAPVELQAQTCSFVPEKQGDTYLIPEQFPNLTWVCSNCNQNKSNHLDNNSALDEQEGKMTFLHSSDFYIGELKERLDRVENNIEKIVRLLEGTNEIKTVAERVRHKELETTNVI